MGLCLHCKDKLLVLVFVYRTGKICLLTYPCIPWLSILPCSFGLLSLTMLKSITKLCFGAVSRFQTLEHGQKKKKLRGPVLPDEGVIRNGGSYELNTFPRSLGQKQAGTPCSEGHWSLPTLPHLDCQFWKWLLLSLFSSSCLSFWSDLWTSIKKYIPHQTFFFNLVGRREEEGRTSTPWTQKNIDICIK